MYVFEEITYIKKSTAHLCSQYYLLKSTKIITNVWIFFLFYVKIMKTGFLKLWKTIQVPAFLKKNPLC